MYTRSHGQRITSAKAWKYQIPVFQYNLKIRTPNFKSKGSEVYVARFYQESPGQDSSEQQRSGGDERE